MTPKYEEHDDLSLVRGSGDARVNVVFVHGLGGGAYSTWHSGAASEMGYWPEYLADRHPKCAVWTLHYTARLLEWNPLARVVTLDLLDRAAWLLAQLRAKGLTSKPIVFVAHSLGGILVKQALQFGQYLGPPEYRLVWMQTRAVLFLATPHEGADLADVAARLAHVIRGAKWWLRPFLKPSPALRNLAKNNPVLLYLSDWYEQEAHLKGIETITFAERRPIIGRMIVDESSAKPHVPGGELIPMPEDDHISIAKPSHPKHLVYERLDTLLRSAERFDPGLPPQVEGWTTRKERAENRRLATRLRGEWWQRHLSIDRAKLSLFSIGPDILLDSIQLEGKGYDEEGRLVSQWGSVLARVEWDSKRYRAVVLYAWTGEYLASGESSKRKAPFNGLAVCNFLLPDDPAETITEGEGHYWNVDESAPEKTRFRRVEFRRTTEPGIIAAFKKEGESEKAVRIRSVLDSWR